MESDVAGVSLNQIDNTASAPAAVFQIVGETRERQERSRSTTPRRTPMQTQDVSMRQEQCTNVSPEVHNQLVMLQQQVSHVTQQQQQNNASYVHQALNVQAADNSAELNVLRNITDSAIHHAQATSAQAQQVVAAVQEQAAQAVRNSEQALMSNA